MQRCGKKWASARKDNRTMTTEEKNNNPEIVEEAKRLKIKSWHLRHLDDVKADIEAAKAEPIVVPVVEVEAPTVVATPPSMRKKAPKMPIRVFGSDARAGLIAKRQAEDPDAVYLFQDAGISDEDLLKKGFERTGETLKNDIVVRTDRKRYEENEADESAHQRRLMDAIDTKGEKIVSVTEQPKKGKT